jgi:hypothetical protein
MLCLLGTVVVVAAVLLGLRWFFDQSHPRTTDAVGSVHGPAAGRTN